MGFWGPFKMHHSRHKYINKYFDVLPDLCNNFGKKDAETFLSNIPRFHSKKLLVERFKMVIKEVNPSQLFFIDTINKIICDYELMMKVESLYE